MEVQMYLFGINGLNNGSSPSLAAQNGRHTRMMRWLHYPGLLAPRKTLCKSLQSKNQLRFTAG